VKRDLQTKKHSLIEPCEIMKFTDPRT